MVIQHIQLASNANRMFGINRVDQAKSTEKLASGYKVNRSSDDAAGLAISEVMRRQVRGLTQASSNAQDGISMVQAAEGAIHEVHDMLGRISELCVKAANDTMTSDDRAYVQDEIARNISEIDRVNQLATFNDINMLNGGATKADGTKDPFSVKLQVGAEKDQYISFEIGVINAKSLGIDDLDVRGNDNTGAADGIEKIKSAMAITSEHRSKLGAVQNRLEHSIRNLDNIVENTSASESKIRDTDMAGEMVNNSIRNIFSQAGISMMSQANQSNNAVLGLLS